MMPFKKLSKSQEKNITGLSMGVCVRPLAPNFEHDCTSILLTILLESFLFLTCF